MEEDHEEADGSVGAGWPLGLPPLTLQMQLASAFSTALHPAHFSFLLATPTCSSLESSDLDTESSLFSIQARSITLGSLMGMRSGSEANLTRAHSLAVASTCSQVSTSHPHHQSCCALELCRKLVIRRQQFKRIATDSAMQLCNNFLIRFAACLQAQHKQTCSSSIDEDVCAVPSLAHLLQMDQESCSVTLRRTVLINIMYEGASDEENPQFEAAPAAGGGGTQCNMNEVGVVNSRVEKRTCFNMGSIKRRVNGKYTSHREALLRSPCIPCV